MSMGACAMPTYSDPLIDAADDSEIAIIENRGWGCLVCIDRIRDADGMDIPIVSSDTRSVGTGNYEFEKFRLSPGEYEIRYSYAPRHRAPSYGVSRVFLKADHVYSAESESCHSFCFRMDSHSTDVWLVDITTGEWIGGCRQGMGCVEN